MLPNTPVANEVETEDFWFLVDLSFFSRGQTHPPILACGLDLFLLFFSRLFLHRGGFGMVGKVGGMMGHPRLTLKTIADSMHGMRSCSSSFSFGKLGKLIQNWMLR